jgi:hypothetical protein
MLVQGQHNWQTHLQGRQCILSRGRSFDETSVDKRELSWVSVLGECVGKIGWKDESEKAK